MKKYNLEAPPRQRTSVPIQGIDVATPDDTVADGKCSALNNLRFKNGAWRPVSPYINTLNTGVSIVYNHIIDGDDHYIIKEGDNYFNSKPKTLIASISDVTLIYHFGNVLFFITPNSSHYYLYTDGNYKEWSAPSYIKTSISKYEYSPCEPTAGINDNETGKWIEYNTRGWHYDSSGNSVSNPGYGRWYPFYNITQGYSMLQQQDSSFWHGEFLLFCTFVMSDGTNLSPSPLHLIKSNTAYTETNNIVRDVCYDKSPLWLFREQVTADDDDSTQDTYLAIRVISKDGTTSVPSKEPLLQSCIASLDLNFYLHDNQKSLVQSIAIWATRLNPILTNSPHYAKHTVYTDREYDRNPWDIPLSSRRDNLNGSRERTRTVFREGSGYTTIAPSNNITDYYADNDLANQPFYLLSELPLSDFTENKNNYSKTITLNKELLDSMSNNRVYAPSNNIHALTPSSCLDYNARLHSASYKETFFSGYSFTDLYSATDATTLTPVNISVKLSEKLLLWGGYHYIGKSNLSNVPFSHIISYPDYRATYIQRSDLGTYPLKPSVANNFSWFHQAHTANEKFPPIGRQPSTGFTIASSARTVTYHNKIQVSAPNNCFNLPFDNSYTVGSSSNKIIALNSPAMEMHEMKIGELPLYVFTEEGIFALQAGSDTLYASVVPVNHDRIINPNTLAINNSIVYATERGIHLLRGATNTIISEPLHRDGVVPIGEYKTCQFIHPKGFNEIVVLPTSGGIAYVYNLDMGYWSTRTLSGVKLNTDELYDNGTIYDLTNENEDGELPIDIMTRPIKLGTLEYKRVETLIPRMTHSSTSSDITVRLTSSIATNALREETISSLSSLPLVFRRTRDSSSYFRVEVTTSGNELKSSEFSITNIDFEWYERFRRRMR